MQQPLRLRAFLAPAFAILVGLFAQPVGSARAADPTFPGAARVGLVPPAGFVESAAFQGFQHGTMQGNILLAELPGVAFESIERDVTAELQRNPQVAARRDITLKDGLRGFVLKGTHGSTQGDILKWTLVATGNDVTALVTVLIPEAVKEVASEEAILAAFATLTLRASVPVEEQLAVLPFRLNDLAGFRIVRVQPGIAAMLTDGPKDTIEAAEQPLLLISIGAAKSAPPPAERDRAAMSLVGEMPGVKDMKVLRSEPLRIAGQQGHELLLEASDANTGTQLSLVQWVRFGSGTLLRIFGVARKDDWEKAYPRFRQIRDGIGPK